MQRIERRQVERGKGLPWIERQTVEHLRDSRQHPISRERINRSGSLLAQYRSHSRSQSYQQQRYFLPPYATNFWAEPFSPTAPKPAQQIDIQINELDRKSHGDFLSENKQRVEKPGRPHQAQIGLRVGSGLCSLEIAKQSQKEKKAGHGHFPADSPCHDLHL